MLLDSAQISASGCKKSMSGRRCYQTEYAKQLVRQLNIDHPGVKDRMFHAIVTGNMEGWPLKGETR